MSTTDTDTSTTLRHGYQIRPLSVDDASALAAAYTLNREHLAPWEPHRAPAFFTVEGQRTDAEAKVDAAKRGEQQPWLIWHADEVVGRVNLTNIVRGVFQSASLGYWVDHRHGGRGIARAAVNFAVHHATAIGLHRVEAGTLAENAASQVVLRRCGFEPYGTAASYLFIAGAWRDHRLFQKILHDQPA